MIEIRKTEIFRKWMKNLKDFIGKAHINRRIDMEFLASIINALARSKGMSRISKELGVTREGLYKSFSAKGNPSFATVMNVLDNLGFGVSVYQKKVVA